MMDEEKNTVPSGPDRYFPIQKNPDGYSPAQKNINGYSLAQTGPILEFLLDALQNFIQTVLKNYPIPVRQEGWDHQPSQRPAEVYEMVMPDPDEDHEKIPYILLQLLNGKDKRASNGFMQSIVNIRIVIVIFNRDRPEGRLQILHIVQQLRRELLHTGVLQNAFTLDGLEYLIYPEETDAYHMGELSTDWIIPPEDRNVSAFLHGNI